MKQVIELKANFENHIDWVNDIQISERHNIFISCSNDKTIKFWKNPEKVINSDTDNSGNNKYNINNNGLIESYYSSLSLNNIHTDYIKGLAYSEKSGNLFTAGYDGKILMMNIDDILNFTKDITYYQNYFDFGSNSNFNSIFAVDCDLSGDTILASVYDNVILNYKFFYKSYLLLFF